MDELTKKRGAGQQRSPDASSIRPFQLANRGSPGNKFKLSNPLGNAGHLPPPYLGGPQSLSKRPVNTAEGSKNSQAWSAFESAQLASTQQKVPF